MILQQLYKDTNIIMKQTGLGELPPSGYVKDFVHFVIDINTNGQPSSIRSVMDGKKGRPMIVPNTKRSSGIAPTVFVDFMPYVLGCDQEDNRSKEKHQAFKELADLCAKQTQHPFALAITNFLNDWNPDNPSLSLPHDLNGGHRIAFYVDGKLATDDTAIQEFWAESKAEKSVARQTKSTKNSQDEPMQMICLLSNKTGKVEDIMPVSVKGVPGGKAEIHIVSANIDAAESYGLKKAQTSPISLEAGERFGKSLNALLASPDHKKTLGSCTYIFWCEGGVIPLFAFNLPPNTKDLRDFLDAPYKGLKWREDTIPTNSRFHLFGLSANAARAVVRSALDATLGEIGTRQVSWFTRLAIISPNGETGHYHDLKTLAVAAYREFKDITPGIEDALVQAVFGPRHQLPESLLQAVVLRCRLDTEKRVTHPRAALLKYLLTQEENINTESGRIQINKMETEITDNMPPAYHCGRLFSELEEIQKSAIPGLNAGISEKFFGSASSNPASVFGILLSGAQNHLSKMRKEKKEAYINSQKRLEEILAEIEEFPKTLSLRDQALFSLGYYHHRAAKRKEISERSAAKKQNSNMTPDLFDSSAEAEGGNN